MMTSSLNLSKCRCGNVRRHSVKLSENSQGKIETKIFYVCSGRLCGMFLRPDPGWYQMDILVTLADFLLNLWAWRPLQFSQECANWHLGLVWNPLQHKGVIQDSLASGRLSAIIQPKKVREVKRRTQSQQKNPFAAKTHSWSTRWHFKGLTEWRIDTVCGPQGECFSRGAQFYGKVVSSSSYLQWSRDKAANETDFKV